MITFKNMTLDKIKFLVNFANFATFYEFKSRFEKSWLVSTLIFSDSTCSGVSKISYGFLVHGRLGQQVPQHDVYNVSSCELINILFYHHLS
jgi:hypothetical protein